MCLRNCIAFVRTRVHPPVFGGIRVAHHFQFYVLCCIFVFSLSSSYILCTQCCQCLYIGNCWLPFRFSLTFIYFFVLVSDYLNLLGGHVIFRRAKHFFSTRTKIFFFLHEIVFLESIPKCLVQICRIKLFIFFIFHFNNFFSIKIHHR